jgi:hypothetical protein
MATETKRSATKLFITLIILVLIVGAGGFLISQYLKYKSEVENEQALENVALKSEILLFTSAKLPDIHADLVKLNYEIRVVDREISRIIHMEKDFPQQKKIILSEKKTWEKIRKELAATLLKLESEIEAIYVTYRINPEKGLVQIEDKKAELLKMAKEILDNTREQTARLEAPAQRSFISTLKEKFITKYINKFK